MDTISLDHIRDSLAGNAAAFCSVTDYQPAGGPGDKVFPPTYEGGSYATEPRYIDGEEVPCVLLDSVQSQANRMEAALLEEWESGRAPLPVITVDFSGDDLPKPFRVTSLEAPHRIADALLRDSELNGVMFRQSGPGRQLDTVDVRNAAALFELCPTALIFGMWDSTGPRGGSGVKFQRALVSEIVGLHAKQGRRTSSRIDPAQIQRSAGPVYRTQDGGWTLDQAESGERNSRGVRPSEVNHGNIAPSIADGGFTISKALQTTVLSLPALRRLRFPLNGTGPDPQVDLAARTTLAAQALFAATLVREQGADLRSRCLLHATAPVIWKLLDRPGDEPRQFDLSSGQAREVYQQAVQEARDAGLPWLEQEMVLKPSRQLLALVRQSQFAGRRDRSRCNGGGVVIAIAVRYLAGWSMATDSADRSRPEWPPHPDRIFMALADAHFETGGDDTEMEALLWLEREGAPSIHASEATQRETVTTYVPVNDSAPLSRRAGRTPSAQQARAGLQLLPENRSRQARQFPVAIPRDPTVYLTWLSDPSPEVRTRPGISLQQGHSGWATRPPWFRSGWRTPHPRPT